MPYGNNCEVFEVDDGYGRRIERCASTQALCKCCDWSLTENCQCAIETENHDGGRQRHRRRESALTDEFEYLYHEKCGFASVTQVLNTKTTAWTSTINGSRKNLGED